MSTVTIKVGTKAHPDVVAVFDAGDFERIRHLKWKVLFSRGTPYVYCQRRVSREKVIVTALHRFIIGAPAGTLVDHVDGNPLNNRRNNLRLATAKENSCNRKAHGRSKYRGVSWGSRQKKWRAAIQIDGQQRHLGYFKEEQEAARVWDAAAIKLHGEFARLNFPAMRT